MFSKTKKRSRKTLVYVNFAPYENAGKILDFINSSFANILLFTFNFHRISRNEKKGKLYVIKNGVVEKEYNLYTIPTPPSLLFLTLPLRSFIIFVQILWHVARLKKEFTNYVFFTVNAFTAWVGIVLKKLGLVEKTIFWVWDYYPPQHESKIVMVMRRLYWYFDKVSTKRSDKVVFLNARLKKLRKLHRMFSHKFNSIIPIGTHPSAITKDSNKKVLGFLGVLKKHQGLDLVLDSIPALSQMYPDIKLEVVGAGPDENYFRRKAKRLGLLSRCKFYGYAKDIDPILERWAIGIATYIPDPSNVSYYGDPSKIKVYLGKNLPIISTDVYEFSEVIKKYHAGVLIKYNERDFIEGIKTIFSKYPYYQKGAHQLALKYDYRKCYKNLFRF